LVALFRPHRRQAALAVLAMLGVALFTAVVAYLFQPLFDEVLSPEARVAITAQADTAGLGAAAPLKTLAGGTVLRKKMPLIRWLDGALDGAFRAAGVRPQARGAAILLAIFVAFLAKNVCSYFALAHFNTVGLAFVRDLRATLYDRLLRQSTSFFARHPSGDLISRATGDVDRIQSLFGTDLADLAQSLATLSSLVVLVVSLSPELTVIALVIAPAIVVPVVVIANRLRKISKAGRERMGDLTGVLGETLRGQRVVQAYGAEAYEAARFGAVNERTYRLARRAARIMAFSSPLVETASVLAFLLLLAYAGSRIAADKMTLGTFISFGVGLVMMYQPFKRATRINLALQTALASARRLFEILDAPVDVVDGPGALPLAPFAREIRFAGVSFAYPGNAPVLHGIDLAVPRGSVTALVGPSGAGKTTLVNLVPRFMDVTAGAVTLDGVDVRRATLASLRAQIGLVTQDVILFDDTVRRNVAYGRDDVPEERLLAALNATNAIAFVAALPEGLDTRVGESGARLSGGQRQRLAIARALLKDPPILILDEATSSLDTESERAVQQALEELMDG
ncbi:MAG TPA: ABC transporter ATP-binding protein, partial [Thermoanaerobaculia bacterium]|nr:ABC transporter ATP-binding protein [Thermoanaerobaculia bacterium]